MNLNKKNMFKKLFFIATVCTIVTTAYAQQDSATIFSRSKRKQLNSDFAPATLAGADYKKGIVKFNLLGTMLNGLSVSYERKIAPKWSLNVASVTSFQPTLKNNSVFWGSSWLTQPYRWDGMDFCQSLALQVRYYHNLERRKRLGKNTHFSGNYFALEVAGSYNRYNYDQFAPYYSATRGNQFLYSASFLYGIQRKIGARAYVDANVGIGIKHYQNGQYGGNLLWPTAKIGIGIAF